jgi:uncharacterized membrane protein YgdD (TMEM256/DUF423 family)
VNLQVSSCILMGTAVACGAFGAHALKTSLSAEMLEVWKTAVLYQALHGLALLTISLSPSAHTLWKPAVVMLAGTAIFSCSLYALALSGVKLFGAVTPIGGLCLIVAWTWLAFSCSKFDTCK